jgi:Bacteriophage Sf6, terminase small subunit-like
MRARSKSRSIQVPAKVGRSTKYSLEWAEGFCALIAEGHSVVEICAKPDMPSQQSVYTWLRDNEDFLERYARAREAQADKLFKECLTIADAARPEDANVARLRVDTRKWAAARLAPKKYGDRVSHDVKGAGSSNFQPQILIQCSSAGEEQEYIDISAAPEAAGSLPQQGNGNSLPGTVGRR